MKDLIERLEKAEGPDRELDYAIEAVMHPWLAEGSYRRLAGDNGWHSPTPPIKGGDKIASARDFTASLDAALTLVPEGRWWVLNSGVQSGAARAQVDAGTAWQSYEAHGATPAIATCIAALRARMAHPAKEGETR